MASAYTPLIVALEAGVGGGDVRNVHLRGEVAVTEAAFLSKFSLSALTFPFPLTAIQQNTLTFKKPATSGPHLYLAGPTTFQILLSAEQQLKSSLGISTTPIRPLNFCTMKRDRWEMES